MKKTGKIKAFYSNLKINKQLLFICIAGLTINLLIVLMIMNYVSNLYKAVAKQQMDTTLKLANNNIEAEFSHVKNLLNDIYIDQSIREDMEKLIGDEVLLAEKVDAYLKLEKTISKYMNTFSYIRSISVYDVAGKKQAGTQGYVLSADMQDLIREAVDAEGQNVWRPIGEGKVVLCKALQLFAPDGISKSIGVVSVHIDMNRMIQFLGILQDVEFKLLVFNDNIVLYESENSLGQRYWESGAKDSLQIDGEHYMASRQKSYSIDFEYVMFTNLEIYNTKVTHILMLMFLLIFIEVLMYGLTAVTISNIILKPIASVSSSIKFAVSNNFEVLPERKYELNGSTENEVYLLYNSFYDMLMQLHTLIIQNYKNNIEKCNIELEMLYSQINPHFLYNTLDTVYWLALQSGNQKIAEMVMSMSSLFRNAINNKENIVCLEKEYKLVEQYLSIQKIRFGDRLSVHVDIAADVLQCVIPKLIIQPVVENSIKHVLDNTAKTCVIRIKAYRDQNRLVIEITDNGPLVCENYRNEILSNKQGMGIKNITRRIDLACGDQGKVLFQIEKTYFKTSLILPLKGANDEKDIQGTDC